MTKFSTKEERRTGIHKANRFPLSSFPAN